MEKEKSREELWEEFYKRAKAANPNLKIDNRPVKSNKRDSLSEFIQTQEQADFFMKMLKMLREEEKRSSSQL